MEYIELGKIAEFVRGPFGGSLKKNIFVNDGIAVYEQQHAIYNQFDQIRYFIDESKFNEMKRFEVKPNDLIMSCSGTMGKVAIVPEGVKKGIINQALLKITPSSKLDSRFLEYYMKSTIFFEFLNADVKGAAIKNVASVKELKKIPIMVISLKEQRTTVAKLDQAFAAIDQAKANIEKNIANAKELFQSKLNQIFSKNTLSTETENNEGWQIKTLGELGKVSMCKRILKNQTLPKGDIPFYKIGTFGKEPDAYISKEIFEEYSTKYSYPKKGQILLSASGTIGRTVIFDGKPSFFQDSNIVWIDNNEDKVLNDFLYQFYKVCDWNPSKGATISRLYNDDLRRIKISFPNIEEQKRLIPQIDKLQEQTNLLVTKYQQKLANLEELKKSILEKAFKGELV